MGEMDVHGVPWVLPPSSLIHELTYFAGMSVGGAAMQTYGGAKNQALLNLHFTTGKMPFGGKIIPGEHCRPFWRRRKLIMPVNSYLLDLNGILFAVQLVLLLTIGPYADYGSWRPYILICKCPPCIGYRTQLTKPQSSKLSCTFAPLLWPASTLLINGKLQTPSGSSGIYPSTSQMSSITPDSQP